MSATEIENTGVPLPRISQVRVLPGFRLLVVWADDWRAGEATTVDLTPVINSYKFYRPLRINEKLFQTAHLIDDGNAVAWGNDEIDMSAEMIEDIARESMTPRDFAEFLKRNHLTQEAIAGFLGYSRRQIGYYLSNGPIPRVVALACYGYEMRQKAHDPASVLAEVTKRHKETKRHLEEMRKELLPEEYKGLMSVGIDLNYQLPESPRPFPRPKIKT
jgi:hypothetical protein